jgi:hypothetical protein
VSDSESTVVSGVPRAALLDAWTSTDWSGGINVTQLSPFDTLTVTTKNSVYTIVVVSPQTGTIEVRGSSAFPSFTPARVCGSSLGGGLLKRNVVHRGFCLELVHGDLGAVVTTRVRAVALQKSDAAPSPPVM